MVVLPFLLFFLLYLHVSIGFYYPNAISRIFDRKVKLSALNQDKPRSASTNRDFSNRPRTDSYARNEEKPPFRSGDSVPRYSNPSGSNSERNNPRHARSSVYRGESSRQGSTYSRYQGGQDSESSQRDSLSGQFFPRVPKSEFSKRASFPSQREDSSINGGERSSFDNRRSFSPAASGESSFSSSRKANFDNKPSYLPRNHEREVNTRNPASAGFSSSVANTGQLNRPSQQGQGQQRYQYPTRPSQYRGESSPQGSSYSRFQGQDSESSQRGSLSSQSFPRSPPGLSQSNSNSIPSIPARNEDASPRYKRSTSSAKTAPSRDASSAQRRDQTPPSYPLQLTPKPRKQTDSYSSVSNDASRLSSSVQSPATVHNNRDFNSKEGSRFNNRNEETQNSYQKQTPKSYPPRSVNPPAVSQRHVNAEVTPRFSSRVSSSTSSLQALDNDDLEDKHHFYSKKSFEEIGCNEKMIKTLKTMDIYKPSRIQALAFPNVYDGKTCIIGDQTGSGKTFAYLLPVIQRLDELYQNKTLPRPQERAPYIIIITPTTELAK
jgi:hypothetical protein